MVLKAATGVLSGGAKVKNRGSLATHAKSKIISVENALLFKTASVYQKLVLVWLK